MLGKREREPSSRTGSHVEITCTNKLGLEVCWVLGLGKGIDSRWNNMFVKPEAERRFICLRNSNNNGPCCDTMSMDNTEHIKAGGRPELVTAEGSE